MWGFMTEDKSKPDQTMEDSESAEGDDDVIELEDSAENESFDDEPLLELVLEAEPEECPVAVAAEPEEEHDENEPFLLDNIIGDDIDDPELSSFEETILLEDIAGEALINDEDVADFDSETDEEAALSIEIPPEDEGDDVIDLDTDAIAPPRKTDDLSETAKDHISEQENGDVIDLDMESVAVNRDTPEILAQPLSKEKDEDVIELKADTETDDVKAEEFPLEKDEDVIELKADTETDDVVDVKEDEDREPDEFAGTDEETIFAPYDIEDNEDVAEPDAGEEKDILDLEAENIIASDSMPGDAVVEPVETAEETIFLGDADHVPDAPEPKKKQEPFASADEETIFAPYDIEDNDGIPEPDAGEEKDILDLEAENILASDFMPGDAVAEPVETAEETIFLGDADHVPEPAYAEKKQEPVASSDEETIFAPYDIEDNEGIPEPDAGEEKDILDLDAENILASHDLEKPEGLHFRFGGQQVAHPTGLPLRDEDSHLILSGGMDDAETIIMSHSLEHDDLPEFRQRVEGNGIVGVRKLTPTYTDDDTDDDADMGEILLTDDDIVALPDEAPLPPEKLSKIQHSESPPEEEVIDLGEDSIVEPEPRPKPKAPADEEAEDTPPFDMEEIFDPDDNATIIASYPLSAAQKIKEPEPEDSADDILPAQFLAGDTEGYQQQEKDLLELLEMDLDMKAYPPDPLFSDEIKEAEKEKQILKTDEFPKFPADADEDAGSQKLSQDAETEVVSPVETMVVEPVETMVVSPVETEIPLQDLEKEIASYPPEQLEAVLEQVIRRVFSEKAFSEKIEGKLVEVIEKAVAKEIDRLKDVLFEDIADDDILN